MIEDIRNQEKLQDHGALLVDAAFHRSELVEFARAIPHESVEETCALGSIDNCLAQLERYREAGTVRPPRSTPTQNENEKLARAWAERSGGPA